MLLCQLKRTGQGAWTIEGLLQDAGKTWGIIPTGPQYSTKSISSSTKCSREAAGNGHTTCAYASHQQHHSPATGIAAAGDAGAAAATASNTTA